MTRTYGRMVAALAAGTLAVAACGDDGDEHGSSSATASPSATADSTTSATFNDADVEFAQGMIAHHEQAIAMAEMALDPAVGASAEVLDLAARIQAAQDPEIDLMTSWLTAWGQPMAMDSDGGHEMSEMDGMMTAEEMDDLAGTTGAAFDTMWMEMMIRHHEGAIAQSDTVKQDGSNPEVRVLADQIITAQQGEIEEMQSLLAG